jgi:hypothetical protein
MHHVRFAVAFLVSVLILGCGNARQQSAQDAGDADTTETSVGSSEQAVGGQQMAPGTVRLRAAVASCDEETERWACTLAARTVLRYGAATDPIAEGDSLRVYFPNASFRDGLAGQLQPDAVVEVAIKRNQYVGQDAAAPTYTAVGLY